MGSPILHCDKGRGLRCLPVIIPPLLPGQIRHDDNDDCNRKNDVPTQGRSRPDIGMVRRRRADDLRRVNDRDHKDQDKTGKPPIPDQDAAGKLIQQICSQKPEEIDRSVKNQSAHRPPAIR